MDWQWGDQLDQADWIADRQPPDAFVCTIPTGFAAYARLLHPVLDQSGSSRRPGPRTRWAQVARWSGAPLTPATRFWQVALPEQLPREPDPSDGAPASDVLGAHDGRALARMLRARTEAPEQCWFGLWEGYGWIEQSRSAPVAGSPRGGTLVRLPERGYLLYRGPVEAGLAFLPERRELADLWWPADRSWFVYGDVDLNATYVGGSAELIGALLASDELEAVPADPAHPVVTGVGDVPAWLERRVDEAVAGLLAVGEAAVSTALFRVRFDLSATATGGARLSYHSGSEDSGGRWNARSGDGLLAGGDLAVDLRRSIIRTIVDLIED